MNIIRLPKIVLTLIFALFLTLNLSAKELDPLDTEEISKALTISTPQQRQHHTKDNRNQTLELLLVERAPVDKNNPTGSRLADIYHYDYTSDETVHSVINLDTQNIISNQRHQYLQLPLTAKEIARATDIIFSDSEQMQLLGTEYLRITGEYLTDPTQLNVKAFSFTAESMPEQLNPASQQCGLNRCAQVLLYTHDSVVFEISPIVNLSAGLVTQNIGY